MNFFWGKLFWYVLVNFKTHGRRCDGAMTGKWNIRLSSKVKSLDLRFQTTANFGQGLRWPNGLRFWTPNTPNILDIDGHWWTLMDIDGHWWTWTILLIYFGSVGKHINFLPPKFPCLRLLDHPAPRWLPAKLGAWQWWNRPALMFRATGGVWSSESEVRTGRVAAKLVWVITAFLVSTTGHFTSLF